MKDFLTCLFIAATFFTACKSEPKTAAAEPPAAAPSPTTCWENRVGQDVTAVELTVDGADATGFMAWEPHEKDGARGSFKGSKTGDVVKAVFTYMIEGATQAEEILLKTEGGKLLKANGELEDKNGVLVIKDPATVQWSEVFESVDCAKIKASVDRAKMVTELIQKQQ